MSWDSSLSWIHWLRHTFTAEINKSAASNGSRMFFETIPSRWPPIIVPTIEPPADKQEAPISAALVEISRWRFRKSF